MIAYAATFGSIILAGACAISGGLFLGRLSAQWFGAEFYQGFYIEAFKYRVDRHVVTIIQFVGEIHRPAIHNY